MLISVIIPVYNGATFIRRAIDSVLNQTYKDFELIIVDDCSTDDTIDIINSYTDKRIKLVQLQENKGAGIARQEGIKLANGEFITFLDSDDALRWDFLEANVLLQSQHDADIVYTSFIIRYDKQYVDLIIPAGDFIMEESATIQMYFSLSIKFLTGKLIRKTLIDKVKFSDKRFGEDVQTLFFLTYLADKVRTSSYAGYVHIFREGSLLADAPEYFCFIHSTLAEIEIIDFLKDHNDKLVGDYMMNVLNQQIKIAKENRKHISNSEKRKYANEWKLIVDYEKLNRNTFK